MASIHWLYNQLVGCGQLIQNRLQRFNIYPHDPGHIVNPVGPPANRLNQARHQIIMPHRSCRRPGLIIDDFGTFQKI